MLKLCYSPAHHKKYPSYVGCTVCEEWKTFSNFRRWMVTQNFEGRHLDKDLLVKDNLHYSPVRTLLWWPLPMVINEQHVSFFLPSSASPFLHRPASSWTDPLTFSFNNNAHLLSDHLSLRSTRCQQHFEHPASNSKERRSRLSRGSIQAQKGQAFLCQDQQVRREGVSWFLHLSTEGPGGVQEGQGKLSAGNGQWAWRRQRPSPTECPESARCGVSGRPTFSPYSNPHRCCCEAIQLALLREQRL